MIANSTNKTFFANYLYLEKCFFTFAAILMPQNVGFWKGIILVFRDVRSFEKYQE